MMRDGLFSRHGGFPSWIASGTLCIALSVSLSAQTGGTGQSEPSEATPAQEEHQHHAVSPEAPDQSAGDYLMGLASGTAQNPQSAPMDMIHQQLGDWRTMFHAQAYVSQVQQTGPRGRDEFFSANWFMGMADRPVGKGSFALRTMISLDPLTMGKEYPLLFQTGETADGKPIVDGQHPHDFFMELGMVYARPVGNGFFTAYVAPVGDPALGPVAFPHRASASELPQAVIGHHYMDSTHIAFNVVTLGMSSGMFRGEVSAFHGGEPDENRWDLDPGPIDSFSARLSFSPSPNWIAQVSRGYLSEPEALHPGDAERTTASLSHNANFSDGNWSSTIAGGRQFKKGHSQTVNSYLAESMLRFFGRHYVTGRFELSEKDELFAHSHPRGSQSEAAPEFRIQAYTLGYTYDIFVGRQIRGGIGANYTFYSFPTNLSFFYGEDPSGTYVFLRLRPVGSMGGHKH